MSLVSPRSLGLVLSGGGARGAYEAGVIRYIREELPRDVRSQVRFDVLCGTSVGAMTACYLAATQDTPERQGQELAAMWSELTLEHVYKVQGKDLWTLLRKALELSRSDDFPQGWRLYDLLHPEPLEELLRTRIPWPRISANLARGLFSALSVSTTQVSNGRTVVFVQRRAPGLPPWSRDPSTEARETIIGPEHALASSAIPLLFRAVRVGEDYYCDGSLRQNTPLSPALRLGAERVLIISLRYRPPRLPAPPPDVPLGQPSTPLLVGKVLNALLLDHTDYDLDRMRRFNALLDAGRDAFGEDFVPRINEAVRAMRGAPYRKVDDLVLRPSRDIATIAAGHARRNRVELSRDALPTRLLHRIARSQALTEGDLASYLLFDGEYSRELIELGLEDTHARREELLRFLLDEPQAS